jgi:class 3 adenylate cyclase
VAGLALGLLIYGVIRGVERAFAPSIEAAVLLALVVGLLLGLSCMLLIKLALRQAAYDLYNYAVDLTDSALPPPGSSLLGDELVYIRETLGQALANVPRPGAYPQLAQDLVAAPSIDAMVEVAARQIASHLPVHGALLLMLDGERSLLYPAASWGQVSLAHNVTLDINETAIGRALQERRSAIYSGAQVRELLPLQIGPESLTLFCLPLLVRGQSFGMLCLTSMGVESRLNDDQRAYARSIADMLTLALQSSSHRQLFNRENDRLSAFEQLGSLLDTSERFDVALEQVLRVAARVTDSIHGTLLLLEPDESRVRYRITLKEGDVLPLSVTAGAILKHGLAGWALRERRADIVDDTERDTRWLPVPGLGEMRSVLVVPLLYGERALGVLTLADPTPRHYSRRGLALASALAAYAVTILTRMQHEEMIERSQVTQVRKIFESHLGPEMLASLLADNGAIERALLPQRRPAVAMVVGLRGLDHLSDTLPADRLLDQVLTPYLSELSAIIYEHHGYITRRHDGGLLAIFGFPLIYGDSRVAVLNAATAVQQAARRLRGRWRTQIGCELTLSAGVAAGEVMVGMVGDAHAPGFAVIGSAVREAARLQQLARVDEVLVSQQIVAELGAESIFQFEGLAPFQGGDSNSLQNVYRLASGRA